VNLDELGPLASAYSKLARADSLHKEMIDGFADFALRDDPNDRPTASGSTSRDGRRA